MQSRDLVDALSCKNPFTIEILIGVGDGAGVNVEASLSGKEGGQARTRCRADAHSNPRLQNAIALSNNAQPRVNDCLVQWMGNRSDQLGGGAARKLRIRIQRQHVADVLEGFEPPRLDGERIEVAGQKLIQVKQLSALAFPSHPDSLPHIEDSVAMQEDKAPALLRSVFDIKFANELDRKVDERMGVPGARLGD